MQPGRPESARQVEDASLSTRTLGRHIYPPPSQASKEGQPRRGGRTRCSSGSCLLAGLLLLLRQAPVDPITQVAKPGRQADEDGYKRMVRSTGLPNSYGVYDPITGGESGLPSCRPPTCLV